MDYARDIPTGQEQWAADIDRAVRRGRIKSEFGPHECWLCQQPAFMVAVGENPKTPTGEYAVSPHFRIAHSPECKISGEESLVRRGVIQSATTQRAAAASFPARLVRITDRETVNSDPESTPAAPARRHTTQSASTGVSHHGPRRSQVSTLLPICRHYIQYARIGFDTRALELPPRTPSEHIRDAPYARAFQHLPKRKLLTANRQVIVFAELMWSAELPDTTNPDSVILPWYAGVINPTTKLPDPGHRLIIDWSDWSPRARALAANDIQRKFEAAHEHGHTARREREWLFAYADPDLINGTDLVVTKDTDYCILTANKGRAWLPQATTTTQPHPTSRTSTQRTRPRRPGRR